MPAPSVESLSTPAVLVDLAVRGFLRIEEVEKETRVGERAKQLISGGQMNHLARCGSQSSKHWSSNPHLGFNPRIARRLFERDEGSHEGNEHRGADFEPTFSRRKQVTQLVNEDQ